VTGVHIVNKGGFLHKNILDANGVVLHKYDALEGQALDQD
jgi:hypothetical protein